MSAVSRAEPQARVLVVDDEAYITDLVGMALRYEGFDVAVAVSGREALSRAGEFRPDLLVLDVMLPDVDGIEVCARLRRDGIQAAGGVPHRPRRHRGQDRRAHRRR